MDLDGVALSKYPPERGNLVKLQRSDLVTEAQRWAAQDRGALLLWGEGGLQLQWGAEDRRAVSSATITLTLSLKRNREAITTCNFSEFLLHNYVEKYLDNLLMLVIYISVILKQSCNKAKTNQKN